MEIIDVGKVRVCISATRVSGRDYVDIRAYTTDFRGILKPTTTGILLPVEKVEDILHAAVRERQVADQRAPAPLYYFQERVDDKTADRTAHACMVSDSARVAVRRTPEAYHAQRSRGYIFKSIDYTLVNHTYTFRATKPFAVWDNALKKWKRWQAKS